MAKQDVWKIDAEDGSIEISVREECAWISMKDFRAEAATGIPLRAEDLRDLARDVTAAANTLENGAALTVL